jgi:hypothetical protein
MEHSKKGDTKGTFDWTDTISFTDNGEVKDPETAANAFNNFFPNNYWKVKFT